MTADDGRTRQMTSNDGRNKYFLNEHGFIGLNGLIVIVFAGLTELIDKEADLFLTVVVIVLGVG